MIYREDIKSFIFFRALSDPRPQRKRNFSIDAFPADALNQRKGKELEGAMEVGSVVRVLRDFLTLNEAQ